MDAPTKRRGRPPGFDTAKRGKFCTLVRAGFSLRNAARHAGIHIGTVYYACRTDPAFDAQLRAAKLQRDRNRMSDNAWRSHSINADQPDEDPAVEAAAQAAYQRLLDLLNQ